jgi:hypothetical protein
MGENIVEFGIYIAGVMLGDVRGIRGRVVQVFPPGVVRRR